MDKSSIIKVENLSFTYADAEESVGIKKELPALSDVSFSISQGEYVAVLGHNGSGKSTLAKLLNMILVPTSGKIYIDGVDVTAPDFTEDDVFNVRRSIGMVFQNPDNQLVATVVDEDVAFGPENLGLAREEIVERVKSSLELVGMSEYSSHAPHKLSGGQKQRVAIAGIIAMRPKVMIFDESTAMLDPLGRRAVIDIMERLNREEGITVINITHYMEEAARADRVIVINDGKLTLDGSAKDVFFEVDKLHKMGLEAPQGRELVHALNKLGFKIDAAALSEKECTEAIINYLKEIDV
ncbi:MAG: energy-coupling factor transporter ATPase [Clostridia bacterium]|nr:energy-coupling factor transporter ATPase [Clostridia bacterium]